MSARVQLAQVRTCCVRIILDTGSGASLVCKLLLPKEEELQRWSSKSSYMLDINSGVLPIAGAVTLPAGLGSHKFDMTYGVVENMSVPLLLSTPYDATQVPLICGPECCVRLRNGKTIPILRGEISVALVTVSQSEPACTAREVCTASLRLASEVTLPPSLGVHVDVVTDFTGNGIVHSHPRLARKHQVHVAFGPMHCQAGVPLKSQVMNVGSSLNFFQSGPKFGSVSHHEGSIVAATLNAPTMPERLPGEKKEKAKSATSSRPHVNLDNVPPEMRVAVLTPR